MFRENSRLFSVSKLLWSLSFLCILVWWVNNDVTRNFYWFEAENGESPSCAPEVILYPLHLANPQTFLHKLRSGVRHPNNLKPINTLYEEVKFSLNSTKPCRTDQDVLIVIKTDLQGFSARMSLRNTWLNPDYLSQFEDIKIRYAFVIGKVEGNSHHSHKLLEEIRMFGDFIIGDFSDTYRNLTVKTMTGIRWAMRFCPKFQFYIAMDDDMLVNFRNVIQFLRDPHSYPSRTERTLPKLGEVLKPLERSFYTGFTLRHTTPIRSSISKYYLSEQEYPPSFFPAYVTGYFAVWSWEMVQNIYHLSPYVKHLAMEDVFVGIIANKLQIPIFDTSDLVRDYYQLTLEDLDGVRGNFCFMSKYLGIHRIYPLGRRMRLWRQINERIRDS